MPNADTKFCKFGYAKAKWLMVKGSELEIGEDTSNTNWIRQIYSRANILEKVKNPHLLFSYGLIGRSYGLIGKSYVLIGRTYIMNLLLPKEKITI